MSSVADLCEPGATPSQLIAAKQEQRLLLRALREIRLHYQVILELYFWEKMTEPQVAPVLDVPEGTVRTRLRTARIALRSEPPRSRGPRVPSTPRTTISRRGRRRCASRSVGGERRRGWPSWVDDRAANWSGRP